MGVTVGYVTRKIMRQAAQGVETMHWLSERKRRRAYCLLMTKAMLWDHCLMSQCNAALPVLCTCTGFNSPHRAMCQVSWGCWLQRALLSGQSGQCLEIYWRTAVSAGKRRRVFWHTATSAVWSLLPSAGASLILAITYQRHAAKCRSAEFYQTAALVFSYSRTAQSPIIIPNFFGV